MQLDGEYRMYLIWKGSEEESVSSRMSEVDMKLPLTTRGKLMELC